MNWWRLISGIISGGLSELARSTNNQEAKAKEAISNALRSAGASEEEIEAAISSGVSTDNKLSSGLSNMWNQFTGSDTTAAQDKLNEFNAQEAQKDRDFQLWMAQNKYDIETQSMEQAGVNPAMMYGHGLVGTQANGAQASAASSPGGNAEGLFNVLFSLMRMPMELKNMQATAERNRAEAKAATENAETNRRNADINRIEADIKARLAGIEARKVDIAEAEKDIKARLADSNIEVNDATIKKLTADAINVDKQTSLADAYYELAKKKNDIDAISAAAAMKQANAAIDNANTNRVNGVAQRGLWYSQQMLNTVVEWNETERGNWIPKEMEAKIDEMKARGYFFNKNGDLVDKQGKLVDAKTAREYVGLACDVANTACRVAGTVTTGGVAGNIGNPGSAPSAGYDVYSGYGTYYGTD